MEEQVKIDLFMKRTKIVADTEREIEGDVLSDRRREGEKERRGKSNRRNEDIDGERMTGR